MSNRYASNATSCRVRWDPSIKKYGEVSDHGMISMTLKHKIKHKHSFTHFNRQALKVPKHAENVNNALVAALGPTELPGPADQRYSALKSAVSAAVKTLPKPQPKGLAIRSQSKKTESLVPYTECARVALERLRKQQHQETLECVKIGDKPLKNVFGFNYLGSEVQADGDSWQAVKVRMGMAKKNSF